MPELPDVEIFKQYLDATALHQEIKKVEVAHSRILNVTQSHLSRTLKGQAFKSSQRHGKFLFVRLSEEPWLVLHFGMTGFLRYSKKGELPEHSRVVFDFESGYQLAYVCQRLLGEVDLAEDPGGYVESREVGPDALQMGRNDFKEKMQGRRGGIKSALMNQKILAGIGNVYSDEILFHAGIHPGRPVKELSDRVLSRLYSHMRRILEETIGFRANPDEAPDDYLLRRREEGQPCPNCSGEIARARISGRSSYFCPSCQN